MEKWEACAMVQFFLSEIVVFFCSLGTSCFVALCCPLAGWLVNWESGLMGGWLSQGLPDSGINK